MWWCVTSAVSWCHENIRRATRWPCRGTAWDVPAFASMLLECWWLGSGGVVAGGYRRWLRTAAVRAQCWLELSTRAVKGKSCVQKRHPVVHLVIACYILNKHGPWYHDCKLHDIYCTNMSFCYLLLTWQLDTNTFFELCNTQICWRWPVRGITTLHSSQFFSVFAKIEHLIDFLNTNSAHNNTKGTTPASITCHVHDFCWRDKFSNAETAHTTAQRGPYANKQQASCPWFTYGPASIER